MEPEEGCERTQDAEIESESLKPAEQHVAATESASADGPSQAPKSNAAGLENVSYVNDETALYTDPETKQIYRWCTKSNQWLPNESPDDDSYAWDAKTGTWVPKVTENEHYRWDFEQQKWVLKQTATAAGEVVKNSAEVGADNRSYGIDELGQRTYKDADGTVFFWDAEKSAWFPKLDDDFMAQYQMSYGFIDNTSAGEREKREREEQEAERKAEQLKCMEEEARLAMEATAQGVLPASGKRKVAQEPPKWFDLDPQQNTKVYVSNLPPDITMDEFAELMGKCGMIMRDPQTQQYKLKLYADSDGQLKGDGLCDYIKVESVELALKLLDESMFRQNKIHVQRAQFQMRGEYNPSLKPKRKKVDKKKLQKIKEKLLDWRPEKLRGERGKNEKVVIIRNLFTPELFEKEVQLILEYQNDLRSECSKCGIVRKVVIYDRHPEGVAQVNMSSPEEADLVITMMQGRFFGQRQLSAEHWDGHTKYRMDETEAEAKERLSKWSQFLETEEAEHEADEAVQTASKAHDVVALEKAEPQAVDGDEIKENKA